jgi:hypothetical protein
MAHAIFDDILEEIEHLDDDQQAELLDVVRRRLALRGRRRVMEEVGQARAQFADGTAKPISAEDLM